MARLLIKTEVDIRILQSDYKKMKTEKKEEVPDVEREGWDAEKIVDEAVNKESDETLRQILRGDESKGNPDNRDIAGSPKTEDTPHGREEEKKQQQEKN